MSQHVAFHLGLHCLSPEVPVLWFLVKKNMLNFQIFSWLVCLCKQLVDAGAQLM